MTQWVIHTVMATLPWFPQLITWRMAMVWADICLAGLPASSLSGREIGSVVQKDVDTTISPRMSNAFAAVLVVLVRQLLPILPFRPQWIRPRALAWVLLQWLVLLDRLLMLLPALALAQDSLDSNSVLHQALILCRLVSVEPIRILPWVQPSTPPMGRCILPHLIAALQRQLSLLQGKLQLLPTQDSPTVDSATAAIMIHSGFLPLA